MNHIDLFSGIGGFAYACKEVWKEEYNNIFFCEIDRYCQEVLKKRFPGCTIYGDIHEVITDTGLFNERNTESRFNSRNKYCYEKEQQTKTWNGLTNKNWNIDLLTGGFPCQPFSHAGKRRGTNDKRFLWTEMFKVIQNTRPRWVIAENVHGILSIEKGMVFEQVCTDLETEGYQVMPCLIPASGVNAPHRRYRVWFIAYCGNTKYVTNTEQSRPSHRLSESKQEAWSRERGNQSEKHNRWERNWIEVATKLCRVDDGLPFRMDGFKLSQSKHRQERLKSLGNAIVPQVAMNIMRAIKDVDQLPIPAI